MAQLWGGRFADHTDDSVYSFNASIRFDKKLLDFDVEASCAHAQMLGKVGIISEEESESIQKELKAICREVHEGLLEITDEYEDIHSFLEANLIKRLGDTGKKVHTGRSRNDQVATAMRLYTRHSVTQMQEALIRLENTLYRLISENTDTYMPGFTHLQKAQPITLSHHLGAYFEMFRRDFDRLKDTKERMNYCPLGGGALAGTTYPLDRHLTAHLLDFADPMRNSLDCVSDRDYLIEYMSDLSVIMMHLSRFCEEIILWNSNEYGFVEISDAFSTGSSIMPQKKNPDIAELIRGKCGRVYGALTSLLTTMKSLPLAYNKDMQEDKEVAFDAMETVYACITLFDGLLNAITFRKEIMKQSAVKGFTNATDAADYLVKKGMPFRDAHSVIGRIVLHCLECNISIDELSIEQLKEYSELFDNDVYEAISLKTCVDARLTYGGPSPEMMKQYITECKQFLDQEHV